MQEQWWNSQKIMLRCSFQKLSHCPHSWHLYLWTKDNPDWQLHLFKPPFVDEFFEAAPNPIKKYMQYIFDFLLAASGAEGDDDQKDIVSQLVIPMEEVKLNWVMMQWASTHFSSVEKIALQHDKQIKKDQIWEASNTITQWPKNPAVQALSQSAVTLGNQNPVDMWHSSQGTTCASSREGLQNPVDVMHTHNGDTKPTCNNGKPTTQFGQQQYNNGFTKPGWHNSNNW